LVKEGGEREKLRDIERKEREWEKGEVVPQNYVGELLAQRLMHAFDVESLEVVYAQPAHRIYESKMRKPIPRWAREGD
jgi:hypothetical protein